MAFHTVTAGRPEHDKQEINTSNPSTHTQPSASKRAFSYPDMTRPIPTRYQFGTSSSMLRALSTVPTKTHLDSTYNQSEQRNLWHISDSHPVLNCSSVESSYQTDPIRQAVVSGSAHARSAAHQSELEGQTFRPEQINHELAVLSGSQASISAFHFKDS